MMTLFLAAQTAANANQGGGGMGMLIMMVAIFAIMWLFMIRPQQKRQKEIRKFQDALTSGSKVVTGGGIYGTVKSIDLVTNKIELEMPVAWLSLLTRTVSLPMSTPARPSNTEASAANTI